MNAASDPVTVIIPLYNKVNWIERSIRSALAQDSGAPEVLVIDDGSTDGSADAAMRLGIDRVRVITQPHAGVSAARNRGLREAKGRLVGLLDADDEWKPGFLSTTLALRERHPDAGLWATAYEELRTGEPSPRRLDFRNVPTDPEGGIIGDFFLSMLDFPPVCSSNVLAEADVLLAAGGFPEGEKLAEDWDTWARVALSRRVAFSPSVQMRYHTGIPGSAERSIRFEHGDTALAVSLRRCLETGDLRFTSRRSVELFLGKHLRKIAEHCVQTGNGAAARTALREALQLRAAPLKCLNLWIRSLVAPVAPRGAVR